MPLRQQDIIILVALLLGCLGDYSWALGEMFSYNSGNQSWYNLTLTMAEQYFIWGEAQYVPSMELVALFYFLAAIGHRKLVDTLALDTILIYDIHTNRFFKQPASNPPPARAFFCSVAAGASNNESYEMCVSPGLEYNIRTLLIAIDAASSTEGHQQTLKPFHSALADNFRNVYILTVPAFQWLQVPN